MALTNSRLSKKSSKPSRVSKAFARTVRPATSGNVSAHMVFWPLVVLVFLVWIVYRSVFNFPVWFDESIGKALFFGLPVWLYISMTGTRSIADTLAVKHIKPGLLLGIAVGGVLGFAATIFSIWKSGSGVQPADLFSSSQFWWEFWLGMMTAFWETLLFYSWIFVVLQEKMKRWSILHLLVVTASIFTLFHIPNAVARFDLDSLLSFVFLMFLFALGQGLLFLYRRNAYALIISHAIWGMVLLLHN